MLKNKWTDAEYESIRAGAKERGAELYPPLYLLKWSKAKCQVDKNKIHHPSEEVFWVSTQDCLEHHLEKIVNQEVQKWLDLFAEDPDNFFQFIYKYGMDGARTGSQYKSDIDQHSILASYMTPLALKVRNKKNGKSKFLWINNNANSWTSVCYLRLAFERESRSNPSSINFGPIIIQSFGPFLVQFQLAFG